MNHIKGLDGLRAIAFLLVFFFHAHFGYFGWVGVQLFFVLSGFLITGILLDMKRSLPTAGYFIKFYGRRFLRIFPLYYLYLFLVAQVATYLLEHKIRRHYMEMFWEQFPYALAYVYNFFMATSKFVLTSQFVTHLWSLAVEEQFYILWPLVIFLTPNKHLRKVFLGAIGLAALFRLGVMIFYQLAPYQILGDADTAIYALPFSHLDAFACGALITLGISLPKAKKQFLVLLFAFPALGMLTDYLTTGQWNVNDGFGLPLLLSNACKPVWGYSILNYLFMLLIYGVVREGWFTRLLEHPWMRHLGKISYGLYVYHYAILWLLTEVIFQDMGMLTGALIALLLTILTASVSFYLIEKPITDLKDRWFPFKPAAKPAQNL
jgi:peptidoglycan/LPS O-acetylase OafA/YrhL